MALGVRETFTDIYGRNAWGGRPGEYYSGYGSEDSVSLDYVRFTRNFIRANRVSTIIDLGCGDFRVGRQLQMPEVTYVGIDVVDGLIQAHRQAHSGQGTRFECLDAIRDPLPEGELCCLRQVLQHLSNEQVHAVLANVRRYRYVLISEHFPSPRVPTVANLDKPHDAHTRINRGSGLFLELPPFNLRAVAYVLTTSLPVALVAPGETVRTLLWLPQGG